LSNNKKAYCVGEKTIAWYRHPILHFPLWFGFAWFFIDFIDTLRDNYEAFFSVGIFVFISALWGILSKMFFMRVPLISRYIYENDYVIQANILLMLIGMGISMCSVLLGGTTIINNIVQVFLSRLK
jgi:hypothetical protein